MRRVVAARHAANPHCSRVVGIGVQLGGVSGLIQDICNTAHVQCVLLVAEDDPPTLEVCKMQSRALEYSICTRAQSGMSKPTGPGVIQGELVALLV